MLDLIQGRIDSVRSRIASPHRADDFLDEMREIDALRGAFPMRARSPR
jgi:hypothetical protein